MNRKLPDITESVTELKNRLRKESVGYKKERLTALYLLQSGLARHRKQVATLIGVSRETVGHWLNAYEDGGIEQMLHRSSPPGRPLCFRRHSSKRCGQNLTSPLALVAMVKSSNLSPTLIRFK